MLTFSQPKDSQYKKNYATILKNHIKRRFCLKVNFVVIKF